MKVVKGKSYRCLIDITSSWNDPLGLGCKTRKVCEAGDLVFVKDGDIS